MPTPSADDGNNAQRMTTHLSATTGKQSLARSYTVHADNANHHHPATMTIAATVVANTITPSNRAAASK